jgi:hypothetical protein
MLPRRSFLSVCTKLSFSSFSTGLRNGGTLISWNRLEWVSFTISTTLPLLRLTCCFRAVDDAELRRTLQSLACGKKKVLKKIPPGRDVGAGDLFRYNADFEDLRAKVHINSIQAKVSVRLASPFSYLVHSVSYYHPRSRKSRSARTGPSRGIGSITLMQRLCGS